MVLASLESLAPLRLAEPWDNVGLLIDPLGRTEFARALVTIDWNETTLQEAIEHEVDLVLAYHPPIFASLKRLRIDVPSESSLLRSLAAGLTVYSPHTALDAAEGGMGDWLVGALGPGRSRPIVARVGEPKLGTGRFIELDVPVALDEACRRIKAHLGLTSLRLSRAPTGVEQVRTLAVCPGAGGSAFEKLTDCDLLLTGEMRHHDVLARRALGSHVVLTDHTNSERGYLPLWAERVRAHCPGLEVVVSRRDADPLMVI